MTTRRSFLAMTSASLLGGRALAQSSQPKFKPARTDFLTFQPQHVSTFRSPSPGLTFSSLYNLESSPAWVRLVYRNEARDSETIDGAAIASTAIMGDGCTAFNAQGKPDMSLWKRVSFASGGDDSRPHAIKASASETIEIGGDASFGRNPPPPTFSDWIPVEPLHRNDGGKGTLLLVRTFSRGQFRNQFARYQKIGGDRVGRVHADFTAQGDATHTPWSFSGEVSEIPAAHAIQYQSAVPGASVLFAGDSILAPPYEFSIGLRACALASAPQLPVSFINQAKLGATASEYVPAARHELEWSRPQILVVQPWSGNEQIINETTSDAMISLSMSLVSFALKNQCAPILVTTPPVPNFPAQEPFRQRSNAQIRGAAANGLTLFDLDKLWANETAPTTFRAGYTRDQIHGSDIACNAAAEALSPIIRDLLA